MSERGMSCGNAGDGGRWHPQVQQDPLMEDLEVNEEHHLGNPKEAP